MKNVAHSPVEIGGPLTKAFSRAHRQEQSRQAQLRRIAENNQRLVEAGQLGFCAEIAIAAVGDGVSLVKRRPDPSSIDSITSRLSETEARLAQELLPWLKQALGEGPAVHAEVAEGETA